MAAQWKPREYQRGDEEGMLELHKLVNGEELSPDWWTWQYMDNPAGPPVIALGISDEGIVGQYTLLPRRMKARGRTCLGALACNVMVHPDYRGQGMYTRLAEEAVSLAAARGIVLGYAFPNGSSHHGFVARLQWNDLWSGIPLMVKPLRLEMILREHLPASRRTAKLLSILAQGVMNLAGGSSRGVPTCDIRELSSFDERFDVLWGLTSQDHEIAVIRDAAYLTWRYVWKPGQEYTILAAQSEEQLTGYIVLKCEKRFNLRTGQVVDIMSLGQRPQVGRDLITAAMRYFRAWQTDVVGCLMLPDTHYSRSLRRAGFFRVPKRFLPQDMNLVAGTLLPRLPSSFVADARNWHITWGDHDVI